MQKFACACGHPHAEADKADWKAWERQRSGKSDSPESTAHRRFWTFMHYMSIFAGMVWV